jgi:hypothetical protein
MTTLPQTITCQISLRRQARQHKDLPPSRVESASEVPAGRVPRVARLMALALRFEQLLQAGVLANYAELARLGHVSRARVSQIMNLLLLAPDIQETLLFLPRTLSGRDPIHLRQLLTLAAVRDWRQQRALWQALQEKKAAKPSKERRNGTSNVTEHPYGNGC